MKFHFRTVEFWTRGRRGFPRSAGPSVAALVGLLTVLLSSGCLPSSTETGALTHTVGRRDLSVSVVEQGTLESSNNTEIRCKVRGYSTVTWVIESGTVVEPGQELLRLDTRVIEETVSLTKTNVDLARAKLARSSADHARASIAEEAYLKGQYASQVKALEKDRSIAETNLTTARKMLAQTRALFRRGYVTDLEVKGHEFTVTRAEFELKVRETQIDVLDRFTRNMQLETLRGNLRAARSKMAADSAELEMTKKQRARALEELAACIVKAERGGLVIYPSAAKWKDTPDVTEGATVRKDQVLLLMPDLTEMQVQVGVHESVVDRVKPGSVATVRLPDRMLTAEVSSVSSVASPAGWWTGNVVEYETRIELPTVEGLKPGMSAEVEIRLARYEDVIAMPVAAVLQTGGGDFAWVTTPAGPERRPLRLGDTDDVWIIVEGGLREGDVVILDPAAHVPEAREVVRAVRISSSRGRVSSPVGGEEVPDAP